MTVEAFTMTLPGNGRLDLPSGNYLKLKTATLPLNLRILKGGIASGVNGESSNVLIRRIDVWERAEIIGTAGTVFTILYGTEEATMQDVTDITTTSSTISGVTVTEEFPTTLAASAAVATLVTANAATIAARAATSRRMIISNISGVAASGGAAGGFFFVQSVGAGARRGVPVYDGQSFALDSNDAFDIRNDSGLTVAYSLQELQ